MSISMINPRAILSPEEIQGAKEAFCVFSNTNSIEGEVTTKELRKVMESMGQNPKEEDLVDMIRQVDLDGNGTLDFEEFLTLMAKNAALNDPEQEIKECFALFDKDGSGKIGPVELKDALKGLGEEMTDEEIQEMMKEADINGDGEIDFDEFRELLLSCQNS